MILRSSFVPAPNHGRDVLGRFGMKLFIDTNWFLDLYLAPVAKLGDLCRIEANLENVVLDRQSRLEFHRRRGAQIDKLLERFRALGFAEAPCLSEREAWKAARDAKQAFDKASMRVSEQLRLARDDIRADEIGRRFFKLVHGCKLAPVTEVIMARAEIRKHRGDPPKSEGPTMGDEIHWEALLAWTADPAKARTAEHLAILTSDKGFLESEHFLREEFLERARRDVVISSDLTTLLNAMTKDASSSLPDDKVCGSCGGVLRLFPVGSQLRRESGGSARDVE